MAEKTKPLDYLKAINPFSYKDFVRHRYKFIINIFLIFLLLSIILFAILLVPKTLYMKHHISKGLNLFTELEINVKADHHNPITIKTNPSVYINLNNESIREGDITITNKTFAINKWPFKSEAKLGEYKDLKERSDPLSGLLTTVALIMLPGILIITALFFVIETIILSLIFTLLGLAVIRLFKRDLYLKKIFKIAIVSSLALMIANAIFIPFTLNFWIPIVIYFIFFCMCGLATSKRIGFKETEKPIKSKSKGKERSRQIFGKKKVRKDDDDFIMLD
jgi:predicted membrane protein